MSLSNRVAVLRAGIANKLRAADTAEAKLADISQRIADHEEAIRLCQLCIQKQSDVRSYVCGMANAFVKPFFGNDTEFLLKPKLDASGVIVGLTRVIVEDGVECDPDEHGGGVNSLISFAIRVAEVVYLHKTKGTEPLLVLDEQMLNLDEKRMQLVVNVLEDLMRQIPLQVIMILNRDSLAYPDEVEVFRSGKVSKIRQWVRN